jgi:hypothetical protein
MKKITVLVSGLILAVLMSFPLTVTADCVADKSTGAVGCLSDSRLKENVVAIEDALGKILSLQGVEFDWNAKSHTPGQHGIGLIAQEVQQVFPTVITIDMEGNKKVDYGALVAPLVEAVKEIDQRDNQEIAQIKELMTQNAALAKELEILKQWICANDPSVELCQQKAP